MLNIPIRNCTVNAVKKLELSIKQLEQDLEQLISARLSLALRPREVVKPPNSLKKKIARLSSPLASQLSFGAQPVEQRK